MGVPVRKWIRISRNRIAQVWDPGEPELYSLKDICKHLWAIKGIIVCVLAFLVPLDLAATVGNGYSKQSKCAYVIIVMAILWLTEAIPIPVTALLPIFLFPMLQVAGARDISASYITDTSMLFLGGLILAVAVEEWNLHKRVAVSVMRLIGAHPSMLMLGLMIPTWFLSMWISNTAATSMMIPIIQAVVHTMEEVHLATYADRGARNPAYSSTDDSSAEGSTFSISGNNRFPLTNTNVPYNNLQVSMLPSGRKPHRHGDDGSQSSLSSTNETSLSTGSTDRSTNGNSSSASSSRPILGGHGSLGSSAASSEVTIINKVDSNESISAHARERHRLAKALALAVAFAANIGGIATLTGTPPNLVLKEMADELYANKSGDKSMESPITFASWMGFAFPLSLITLVIAWLWLLLYFMHGKCFKKQEVDVKDAVNTVIKKQFKDLGFISFAEGTIIVVFVILVILWLFREPPNFSGWGAAFYDAKTQNKYVTDSTPVLLLSVAFFVLPAKKPSVFRWAEDKDSPSYTPILTWTQVEKKVSWGVIILLGGGFAIARASKDSGLSDWLGNELKVFANNEPWVTNVIFVIIISLATEVTSNTAMATLLLPVMASVGLSSGIHPLYLMVSATIAVSFAFMLPVATPPNAIVFSTGYITITDMALTGLPMSLYAVVILIIAINSWGKASFSLDDIPEYFKMNVTSTS